MALARKSHHKANAFGGPDGDGAGDGDEGAVAYRQNSRNSENNDVHQHRKNENFTVTTNCMGLVGEEDT